MSRHQGFTLVEVLVALAVIGIALLAAMRASGQALDDSARLRDAVLGEQCAETVLVDQRLTRDFPSVGQRRIACTQAGHDFTISVDVATTPNPAFRRVDVAALTPDGHVAFTLATIVGNF